MKVKALVSFTGKISMLEGEERELADKDTLSDLLKAGYVKEVKKKKEKSDKDENQ